MTRDHSALAIVLVLAMAGCGSVNDNAGDPGRGIDADQPTDGDGSPIGSNDGGSGGSGDGGGSDVDGDAGGGGGEPEQYSSGSRIKKKIYQTPGGAEGFAGWYDSMLDVDCGFGDDGTGTTRCLPSHTGIIQYYADMNCTNPVAWASCTAPAPAYAVKVESGQCAAGAKEFFEVEASIATPDPAYAIAIDGQCVETTAASVFDYYSLSAEVPVSTFQSATVSVVQ